MKRILKIAIEIDEDKIENLIESFNTLKNRIIKHRQNCPKWKICKPCFDCHKNTLTSIERNFKELK